MIRKSLHSRHDLIGGHGFSLSQQMRNTFARDHAQGDERQARRSKRGRNIGL
jgi:hypothetical protein